MGLWVFCRGLSSLASYSLEKKQSGMHECKKNLGTVQVYKVPQRQRGGLTGRHLCCNSVRQEQEICVDFHFTCSCG